MHREYRQPFFRLDFDEGISWLVHFWVTYLHRGAKRQPGFGIDGIGDFPPQDDPFTVVSELRQGIAESKAWE